MGMDLSSNNLVVNNYATFNNGITNISGGIIVKDKVYSDKPNSLLQYDFNNSINLIDGSGDFMLDKKALLINSSTSLFKMQSVKRYTLRISRNYAEDYVVFNGVKLSSGKFYNEENTIPFFNVKYPSARSNSYANLDQSGNILRYHSEDDYEEYIQADFYINPNDNNITIRYLPRSTDDDAGIGLSLIHISEPTRPY